MNKEDYFKYYIQGSDHYLIPKDVFDELFEEMESWKENTNKYKEVIDKVSSQIKLYGKYNGEKCTRGFSVMTADFNKLLDILEEEKEKGKGRVR